MKNQKIFLGDVTSLVVDYFADKIQEIENLLSTIDKLSLKEILARAEDLYYFLRYFEDIDFFSKGANFAYELNPCLAKEIKHKVLSIDKLPNLFNLLLKKIKNKTPNSTVVQIGENLYVYFQEKYFEKSELENCFYQVDEKEIFLLSPRYIKKVKDHKFIRILENIWQKKKSLNYDNRFIDFLTWYKQQDKKEEKVKILNHLPSVPKIISPHEYQKKINNFVENYLINSFYSVKTLKEIAQLVEIKNPKRELFRIFKILNNIIKFVEFLRRSKEYTRVYLLRDGLLMYQADFIISLLEKINKKAKIVLLNRAMLSSKQEKSYFFPSVVKILYKACEASDNFKKFLSAYHQLFKKELKKSSEFNDLAKRIYIYLLKENILNTRCLRFIDTGLRGSMPLFLQGTVEAKRRIKTNMYLYTVGPWFRDTYTKKRYFSNNYSFMRDVESLSSSENLYKYVPKSFDKGYPEIKMGSRKEQMRALLELIALSELCKYYFKK